jgi:hypothetical protein
MARCGGLSPGGGLLLLLGVVVTEETYWEDPRINSEVPLYADSYALQFYEQFLKAPYLYPDDFSDINEGHHF